MTNPDGYEGLVEAHVEECMNRVDFWHTMDRDDAERFAAGVRDALHDREEPMPEEGTVVSVLFRSARRAYDDGQRYAREYALERLRIEMTVALRDPQPIDN